MTNHTETACVALVAAALFAIPALSDAPAKDGMTFEQAVASFCGSPVERVTLTDAEITAYRHPESGTLLPPRLPSGGWVYPDGPLAGLVPNPGHTPGSPNNPGPTPGVTPKPVPEPAPIPLPAAAWLLLPALGLLGVLRWRSIYRRLFA